MQHSMKSSREDLKNQVFMKVAFDIAQLSHCVSKKVGAVIVKDGRILSTGINGTPAGYKNCEDIFNESNFQREKHHEFSETFEIHAETNAILFAARNGINISESSIYITLHPCKNCLKMLINAGIKKIYYNEEYDLFNDCSDIKDLLSQCGVELIHVKLSLS